MPSICPFDLSWGIGPEKSIEQATDEYYQTQTAVLESGALAEAVAKRLNENERLSLLAPYAQTASLENILLTNRRVELDRAKRVIRVRYVHPDAQMAAQTANYFAEAYMRYLARKQSDDEAAAIKKLDERIIQQRTAVQKAQITLDDSSTENAAQAKKELEIAKKICETLEQASSSIRVRYSVKNVPAYIATEAQPKHAVRVRKVSGAWRADE